MVAVFGTPVKPNEIHCIRFYSIDQVYLIKCQGCVYCYRENAVNIVMLISVIVLNIINDKEGFPITVFATLN